MTLTTFCYSLIPKAGLEKLVKVLFAFSELFILIFPIAIVVKRLTRISYIIYMHYIVASPKS